MNFKPFIFGIAASFAWCVAALPNGGGYEKNQGWTGQFTPTGLGKVEMLSEKLNIHFSDDYATVEVVYQFKNAGSKRRVKMGFPTTTTREVTEDDYPYLTELELKNYRISKDGKALKSKLVSEKTSIPVPGKAGAGKSRMWVKNWQVSEIDFGKGETAEVRIKFRQGYHKNEIWVSDDGRSSEATFSYVFSSASGWKGPIGKGEVTLTVDTLYPEEFQIEPRDRFQRDGNTYTWNFENLEPQPDDDLRIRVFDKSRDYWVFSPSRIKTEGSFPTGGIYELRSGLTLFTNRRYQVEASSTLAPQGELQYDAKNIIDSDPGVAWVEGVKGDGIGESLTLTMQKPLPVHHINIVPGYSKSEQLWFANNRVAKLEVTANNEKTWTLDVPESHWESKVSLALPGYKKPVETLTVKIAGVYSGTKFRDTCISAIEVANVLDKRPSIQGAR